MVAHPCRLAIEARRFDLRVHRETTRSLADRALPLLEHAEYLLEHGGYLLELLELRCRFGMNRVQSPKDHVRRYECADLKSHLVVVVVNKVRLRNLSAPRTCHRVRMLLIFAFTAANFSRKSPDFHSSLRPGLFFLPGFGLIEFSHSSRSRRTLRPPILWSVPAANGTREAYSASSLKSVSSSCWSNRALLLL